MLVAVPGIIHPPIKKARLAKMGAARTLVSEPQPIHAPSAYFGLDGGGPPDGLIPPPIPLLEPVVAGRGGS